MRLPEMPERLRQAVFLAGFLVLCLAAGGLGALLTAPAIPSWYASIARPSWTPPNRVFGPVWTALYVMMAFAGWLVWRSKDVPRRRPALVVWVVQLALNALWSPLFFGLHAVGPALVDIYLLWLFIGRFIITAWVLSRPAAILFMPYWAWVTFASALNLAIWIMNGAGRN
jgi:translocator protein